MITSILHHRIRSSNNRITHFAAIINAFVQFPLAQYRVLPPTER